MKATRAVAAAMMTALIGGGAMGQAIHADFECAYTFDDLGTPAGVPGSLGGLVFKSGDPNTLLIGGNANAPQARIYQVGVTRQAGGHITGFSGTATVYADAPNIDGGLSYASDGVLFYSRYSMNHVGQFAPGSTVTDRNDDLSALGFSSSVGALAVVPDGFPGAGRLKVLPYNSSQWHDAALTPDGSGTYNISSPLTATFIDGGPEGIVYVEGSASLFDADSVLISEYGFGSIAAYEIDSNGDPIPATRKVFMSGLSGAEGGTRDPMTGDFLFSTFGGGDRVLVVRGFTADCAANYNADCAINTQDFIDFLNDWTSQVARADLNDDGLFNTADVLVFLNLWVVGCDG